MGGIAASRGRRHGRPAVLHSLEYAIVTDLTTIARVIPCCSRRGRSPPHSTSRSPTSGVHYRAMHKRPGHAGAHFSPTNGRFYLDALEAWVLSGFVLRASLDATVD